MAGDSLNSLNDIEIWNLYMNFHYVHVTHPQAP
jgi:hypothetical protein